MSVKDWIFSQLLSKSFASARPLSGGTFFEEESVHDESADRGSYLATAANNLLKKLCKFRKRLIFLFVSFLNSLFLSIT